MGCILGLDVGGTSVKGMVFRDGVPVLRASVPSCGGKQILNNLEKFAKELIAESCSRGEKVCVGAGIPGIVDGATGNIVRAPNIGVENYPLKALLEERLGAEVRLCNDANAAVLGEARFGAGKGLKDVVMITLGTGVGGGVITGGRLLEGNGFAGGEIGHMVIVAGGRKCACGRRGCFEAYCSARALTEFARESMRKNPSSAMWKNSTPETADGATAFGCAPHDKAAYAAVKKYLKYLACGIANVANIFRPQAVILGGGVSAQGENLIAPLKKLLKGEIFAYDYAPVEIKCAALGNDAGAYGAAALFSS